MFMVKLCGVVSPRRKKDKLGHDKIVAPNIFSLVDSIVKNTPRGKVNIGIQDVSDTDWEEVNRDWYSRFMGVSESTIHFPNFLRVYWNSLRGMLTARGFNIVPLERAEDYVRTNEIRANLFPLSNGDISSLDELPLSHVSGEDSLTGHLHFAKSFYELKRIEEIDRADLLLRRIGELGVDVAIVGKELSNHWMANLEKVRQGGVVFDTYSGERLWCGEIQFLDSLPVNGAISNRRDKLERTLTLLRGERLTERNPHLIGSWSIDPLKGYFEMFFDGDSGQVDRILSGEQSGQVSGTIEDCLGGAVFTGNIGGGKIILHKDYGPKFFEGKGGAVKDTICYEGSVKISPNLFESSGSFRSMHKGGRFFITSDPNIGLVKLGLKYDENNKPSEPEYE